ncbi:MAG: hypothetical protein U9Q62_06340 [Campylobacterota bacterium]|nr:hypothetical protein [Campylobacterota bacterium]
MKLWKLLIGTGLLFSALHAEMQIVPKVGLAIGQVSAWGEGGTIPTYEYKEDSVTILAPRLAIMLNSEDFFLEFQVEGYEYESDVFGIYEKNGEYEHTQTEMTFVGGINVYKNIYLLGGYRANYYGDSYFNNDYADNMGPFIGVSINNLTMGDDRQDIFSYAIAYQFGEFTNNDMNRSPYFEKDSSIDSLTLNMKFAYRRAGSNFSYDLKYQLIEGDEDYFNATTVLLGINYSFIFSN